MSAENDTPVADQLRRLEDAFTEGGEDRPRAAPSADAAPATETSAKTQRPAWLPKKAETLARWSAAYEVICAMKKEERDPDDWGDDPRPRLADFRDRLAEEISWKPSDKTVSRIIQAGDTGWLT